MSKTFKDRRKFLDYYEKEVKDKKRKSKQRRQNRKEIKEEAIDHKGYFGL